TTVAGPAITTAGAPVTYTVVTSNAGLSTVAGVTQTVTLPAGVTTYSINGGAQVTTTAGATILLTVPAMLYPGTSSSVSNTITFNAPTSAFVVNATASATGDATATGNNASAQATAIINKAPVAANIVNSLQAPESNSAGQLFISSLSATDPEGNAITYTITKAPDVAQGRLYYNNGGTYTLVADNLSGLTATQAATLKFDPAAGFVGNAFFTYTATDGAAAPNPGTSNVATYLIPVGADNAAVYTSTPTKGGNANQYQNGDVLAYGIDPNGAAYNTAGLIYNLDGSTATGTVNKGIRMGKISLADSTLLASRGIRYTFSTGLFTVVDRTLLPRTGQTIPVSVTTVDLFGGITTQTVSLVLGQNPLPVELTAFVATAKNLDALLSWSTASEKSNDHFDIERSLNGTDFVKIAEEKGQGTRTSATNYARTDAGIGAKVNGLVYYRLKQVDTDGTSSYSPVRTVRFSKVVPAIALFPNPATTATNLDLTALPVGSYQVSVLDAAGRVVLNTTLDSGLTHVLQLNTIGSGTYVVLVRGASKGQAINLTKRLVKE
ncbi:MAG TPA: T9SS type A sorting domain-containing protein, partial [Hymenobacter sp.]